MLLATPTCTKHHHVLLLELMQQSAAVLMLPCVPVQQPQEPLCRLCHPLPHPFLVGIQTQVRLVAPHLPNIPVAVPRVLY